MGKIQFDIKFRPQIESGEYKVITAKEQPVRIICWDRSTTYWKIIALVLAPNGKTENPFTYDVNGKESDGCLHNHELDLFLITPEPELTEFELKVHEILYSDKPEYSASDPESWKQASSELLALARKEIEKGLPRWKKCDDGNTNRLELEALCREAGSPIEIAFRANGYRIFLSDIEKLPKEE